MREMNQGRERLSRQREPNRDGTMQVVPEPGGTWKEYGQARPIPFLPLDDDGVQEKIRACPPRRMANG
jgi:hypothetical protein